MGHGKLAEYENCKKEKAQPQHDEVLYVKRNGRYIEASDPWACTGLRNGHWHIWVRENAKTTRKFVLPERRGVSAAMEEAREAMADAMLAADRVRPQTRVMDEREQRAWAAYRLEMGMPNDKPVTLSGISINDLIDAGIQALAERKYAD